MASPISIYIKEGLRLRMKLTKTDIASVPEEYRIAYRAVDEDDDDCKGYDFILCVAAANYCTEALAELAALNAQLERLKVDGPKMVAAEKQASRDHAVHMTLYHSLAKAGVKQGLIEGAMDLLQDRNDFEVGETDGRKKERVVHARTERGLLTVDALVQEFVQAEGAAYLERRAAPTGGHFSQLQSGLKARR
ncbi:MULTISPECIES: hypothetical protein [unclassified Mesorhizobium]|uniref:hypothetical protein n=1 Tax=unclassified Mesorhizobium TaxID=325217 RepID=UPI000FCA2F79|nr:MULTISPECIES: hypothetical protein [unclassified Mesorhizobium]RUU62661.1 hypothetical protein EOC99_17360 [Mesorhizobium sp. M7A.T.Ca.TU.009.01.1.1]RUU88453.1 hypothetical protein EOD03_04800 [Mesorhizobium sp. M7A.T.Ca.TU.009.01.1.2]RUT84830.1 hypothetical protein EOD14_19550 [Mesorhizobium sp. M7A.T.Ca.US.000.02.1.1]RUT94656.1 hypothetical protein EOD15_00985 [Mesorhizobium sp. M7A.T.Ca.US.000.02.2.1]RUU03655.1 hypothetical protein EOD12_09550 [Mesorhizobium sp. M7A.T.Ca.TU.009.02.1.1]